MKINNQTQLKKPLKFYPKRTEDVCNLKKWSWGEKKTGATSGSLDDLIIKFRNFYKEAHPLFFDLMVKEVWLEQQITYNGMRRMKRYGNGLAIDTIFGIFTSGIVGTTHRVITSSPCFTPIATYFVDFFPEFLINDPFKNPEKYKYPYENITLDHLIFVHQMDNRLELLEEAEEKKMLYSSFVNWSYNWAVCHNLDGNLEHYQLIRLCSGLLYIRNNNLKRSWRNNSFNFKTNNE